MAFKDYLTELLVPAPTLSPLSIEEIKDKDKINNEKVFPTDEVIKDAATKADEAFWRVIVEIFKDKLDDEEFKPTKQMETFKEQEKDIIKAWLKENWPNPEDLNSKKPKVTDMTIRNGNVSFEPPAVNRSAADAGVRV